MPKPFWELQQLTPLRTHVNQSLSGTPKHTRKPEETAEHTENLCEMHKCITIIGSSIQVLPSLQLLAPHNICTPTT